MLSTHLLQQNQHIKHALSKFFVLPSLRLLRDYIHWIKYPCSGTNINVIQSLIKDITHEGFDPHGFKVTVLVDEMKIKSDKYLINRQEI